MIEVVLLKKRYSLFIKKNPQQLCYLNIADFKVVYYNLC